LNVDEARDFFKIRLAGHKNSRVLQATDQSKTVGVGNRVFPFDFFCPKDVGIGNWKDLEAQLMDSAQCLQLFTVVT